MSKKITPGRWRGLKTTSLSEQNIFAILAFDQRGSYRRMLPQNTPYKEAVHIKEEVVGVLSRYASAVLLDPIYGLGPAMKMNGKSGLVMALEKSGYSGDTTYRRPEFRDTWTAAKIRNMGASAIKLLVYYNPNARELADELDELVERIVADCHAYDLPVFLEPMSYSLDANIEKDSEAFAAAKPEIVRKTAERLCRTGADVLKLEFPVDPKFSSNQNQWRDACAAISQSSSIPWVLLSAGVDFETFEQQTHIACANGASGFLAGRAIWKECVTMSPQERKTFLNTTASDRIQQLIAIAAEKSKPWSEFFSSRESSENWFETT